MATSPTSSRNPPPHHPPPNTRRAARRRRANLNGLLCFRPQKGLRKHSKSPKIRNEPSTRRSTEAPRNKTAGKQAAPKRDQTRIRDSKTVNRQFFQKDSNPSKIDRRQPSTPGHRRPLHNKDPLAEASHQPSSRRCRITALLHGLVANVHPDNRSVVRNVAVGMNNKLKSHLEGLSRDATSATNRHAAQRTRGARRNDVLTLTSRRLGLQSERHIVPFSGWGQRKRSCGGIVGLRRWPS